MSDVSIIATKSALETHSCGSSLSETLYGIPVTIGLTGELGAGKTTFLQGFGEALGIRHLTSPTYALEQRYETPQGPLLHIDLYRLTEEEAAELLKSSEDFAGIRCVEWFPPALLDSPPLIHMHFQEGQNSDERIIHCTFTDTPLLSQETVEAWRKEVLLPDHIAAHCDAVADFCDRLAEAMMERGHLVRKHTLHQAACIHDLLRFIDFRPGGHPDEPLEDQRSCWETWSKRFANLHHEAACAAFLRQQKYSAIADIVEVHGLTVPVPVRSRIEQKLLFYADKRVQIDQVVTLKERFEDFTKRYGASGAQLSQRELWYEEAKAVEDELFLEGVPF